MIVTTVLALILGFPAGPAFAAKPAMVTVPAGDYKPIFRDEGETDTRVGPLEVDRTPVTNEQFLGFVRANPEWRRGKIPSLFADGSYLKGWDGILSFPKGAANHPVTHVSWFAARAYCEAREARLPTVAEWEYFSGAGNPEYEARALAWYAKSGEKPGPVGKGKPNAFGLHDTGALVWEWVEDFSGVVMSVDSRRSSASEDVFCGAGSVGAKDPTRYAAFMRYAFRSSLKGAYTTGALGFRCVKDAAKGVSK